MDKGIIPLHIMCCVLCTYWDYDKENHDRSLFGSYFYSKEQLNKFKDLLVNDIPQGIVILNQGLSKCLFANKCFLQLTEDGPLQNNLQASLNKFVMYDNSASNCSSENNLDKPSTMNSSASSRKNETLFMFLKNLQSCQRLSCNLKLKKQVASALDLIEPVFEVKIIPLFWEEQQAIGVIFNDITQQDVMTHLKIASNLNIQKDKILATVSHELRTPLNGILGMIQVIKQKVKCQDINHYLNICSHSGVLLLGLVNSILDLNLIRANKLKLNPERIDFAKFLQDIIQLFEYQCNLKEIFIKADISPFFPTHIITDKGRLSQIFINLIGNALKFTSKGGITVSAQVYNKDKNYLQLSVLDTGIGIQEKDKCKLFQIFGKIEHEEGSTAVNHQGVGLGLTISNSLVDILCDNKKLQGIDLQSEYGKGTKFSFLIKKNLKEDCLPRSSSSHEEMPSEDFCSFFLSEGDVYPQNAHPNFRLLPSKKIRGGHKNLLSPNSPLLLEENPCHVRSSSNGGLTSERSQFRLSSAINIRSSSGTEECSPYILVVDDNPFNVAVAELLVLKQQYQVKTALYGQVAIDIMLKNDHQKNPIKLILMDLQMPVMDGYQTTKVLKEMMKLKKIPNVPIVALTANDSEDDKKACQEVGMCDYLTKPMKETELIRILRRYS